MADPFNTPTPPTPAEARAQQRALVVRIVRYAFVVLLTTVTLLFILKVDKATYPDDSRVLVTEGWYIPLFAAAVLAAAVLSIDILTPKKKIATISGVFFGLLAGLLATFALGFVVDLLAQTYDIKQTNLLLVAVKVLLGISLCYLSIATVMQTQDDFRLVIPYVEFAKQIRGTKPLLLDTSALIDARIMDLALTGVFQTPLVIPRFVVTELQTLADSDDKSKRLRGRRGLDVVSRLQRAGRLDVTIDETPVPGKAVDQMLVELARTMPGIIATTDTGLARVAGIQGVVTLNLNEIAIALKPSVLPGTHIDIVLMKPGEQPEQAVGYLDDGTMVVVDRAAHRLGAPASVEVTSALQTSAGRLIFARLAGDPAPAAPGLLPQLPPDPSDGDDREGESNANDQATDAIPQLPPASPISPPLTVRPPSAPPAPSPQDPDRRGPPPSKAPRNPWRNPRR